MRLAILVILILIFTVSCDSNQDCPETPEFSSLKVNIELLHEEFLKAESADDVLLFLSNNKDIARLFLENDQYPNDSILANTLYSKLINPHFDTLFVETRETFGDFNELEAEFESAFRFIKSVYPDFEAPEIKTMITGFDKDLYVSDSLIIIGLDYYLGKEATFRPIGLPQYILDRYRKEYIVPSSILLLSNGYNSVDPNDQTLLADMLFYGKAYAFAQAAMPCIGDSLILGYTGQQVSDTNENTDIIWSHFIVNELLYETGHRTINRYVGERPKTFEIGDKCPGRIGAWLGWQIIKKYQEENNISLTDLMKESNAGKIFMQSKYKPDRH